MQICRTLAGYSYARADIVRRAMSKKKTDAMQAEREGFIKGCFEHNVSTELAEEIFEEMVGFAKYAFNKSHATAYGIISYRTAYLKTHYPAEYFSALLTSVLDNSQKLKEYIADAQKFGVNVLAPDINASRQDFAVYDGNIRFGLLAIRNVGRQFANSVISERSKKLYSSFDEFVSRVSPFDINKRTVESLIKCGVFDSLGTPRSALLSCYENIIESEHDKVRNNISGQMDLFSFTETSVSKGYHYPQIPEYPIKELLLLEKESSGMYFSGHMIDDYSNHISTLSVDKISDILIDTNEELQTSESKYKDKQNVRIAGIITSKRTKNTKNGDTMAFIKIEDRFGEIEVIVFARQYSLCSDEIYNENAVVIEGSISLEEGEDAKILLSSIERLESNADFKLKDSKNEETKLRVFIKVPNISDARLDKLSRIALLNPGRYQIVIFDSSSKKYSAFTSGTINATDNVKMRLISIFGEENVVIK